MHIFLVLSDKTARDMIMFTLESKFQARISQADSAAQAIQSMRSFEGIDLIFCDHPLNTTPLFAHFSGLGLRTPFVIHGNVAPDDKAFERQIILGVVHGEKTVDQLQQIMSELQYKEMLAEGDPSEPKPEKEKTPTDLDPDFCRIKTGLLLRVSPLKADIYIRLSASKYIKLFREGDHFDANDQKKYMIEKKLEYFYLKKSESGEFMGKFKQDLAALLAMPTLPAEKAHEIVNEVHETVQQLITKLGPTAEVQEIVKASVAMTLKSVGSNPSLKSILGKFDRDKKKYIPSHSNLMIQFACSLSAMMGWNSEMTFQKLNLAAFLHDITLDNHELATIKSLPELSKSATKFSKKELDAFKNHTIQGSEMAKRFNEIPPDVDTIIAQHHERPDGSGFPRGLTHLQISPLGVVFIVAHDIVSHIFAHEGAFEMEGFLASVKDEYSGGNFKKALKCLGDLK
jgi:response regulator RpfG family c-di-GMP phosphodiesterase